MRSVEETDDLASDVLSSGLLVVHDTSGGGEDDVAELTRGKKADDPLLEVTKLHVVARADDTGLVEAAHVSVSIVQAIPHAFTLNIPAVELDDDLAVAVVIDLLELADVAFRNMSVYVASD